MEKKQEGKQHSMLVKIIVIGFIGGIIWSFVNYLVYIMHFTEVGPNFLLLLFRFGNWKERIIGQYIAIGATGVISIGLSFLYYGLFRRFMGVFPGIIFGLILWVLVYVLLPFLGANTLSITEVARSTITTSICVYLLYGVFIAYSVSYANYSNKEDM